jgi:hypothetical protein
MFVTWGFTFAVISELLVKDAGYDSADIKHHFATNPFKLVRDLNHQPSSG